MNAVIETSKPQTEKGTKLVEIRLAALTRLEYMEVVEVPANITDDELQALVNRRYDDVDGGAYWDDPDYWERGHCYATDARPEATPSLVAWPMEGGMHVERADAQDAEPESLAPGAGQEAEAFEDVEVWDAGMLESGVKGPFVVIVPRINDDLIDGLSEDAACRYQRVHRLAHGRDPMTGDPLVDGKDSLPVLLRMWDELADVPVNEAGMLEEPFLHFKAGESSVESVWRWFESRNAKFVVAEVQQGQRA